MTIDAIRRITSLEEQGRADKAAAEARVKQALADAERAGETRLEQARNDAAARNKDMLRQAEERAAVAAAETAERARRESDALRTAAQSRLDEAAELIVERVVRG